MEQNFVGGVESRNKTSEIKRIVKDLTEFGEVLHRLLVMYAAA